MVMDTSFRSVLGRAVGRAGASERIRPHSGRRWLVTRLAEKGAHVKEISKLLGDEDLEVIMSIYMQVRTKIRILETQKKYQVTLSQSGNTNLARLWALRGDDAKHGGVSDVCKSIFGFGFME